MVEFLGEGLIQDGSFRIHWLIWIQLLVFLLLLLLLYSLSSSSPLLQFDPPSSSSSSSVLPSSSPILLSTTTTAASSSSYYRRLQKKELVEEEMEVNINRDMRKGGRVEMERETGGGLAGKESGSGLAEVTHPCHIVRLARMAFLKCFGLGTPPPRR